jgi:hypothetical protein
MRGTRQRFSRAWRIFTACVRVAVILIALAVFLLACRYQVRNLIPGMSTSMMSTEWYACRVGGQTIWYISDGASFTLGLVSADQALLAFPVEQQSVSGAGLRMFPSISTRESIWQQIGLVSRTITLPLEWRPLGSTRAYLAQYNAWGYGIRLPYPVAQFLSALIVGVAAVVLLRRLRRWMLRRSRRMSGCCEECGYDLRAGHEKCPECGAVSHVQAATLMN